SGSGSGSGSGSVNSNGEKISNVSRSSSSSSVGISSNKSGNSNKNSSSTKYGSNLYDSNKSEVNIIKNSSLQNMYFRKRPKKNIYIQLNSTNGILHKKKKKYINESNSSNNESDSNSDNNSIKSENEKKNKDNKNNNIINYLTEDYEIDELKKIIKNKYIFNKIKKKKKIFNQCHIEIPTLQKEITFDENINNDIYNYLFEFNLFTSNVSKYYNNSITVSKIFYHIFKVALFLHPLCYVNSFKNFTLLHNYIINTKLLLLILMRSLNILKNKKITNVVYSLIFGEYTNVQFLYTILSNDLKDPYFYSYFFETHKKINININPNNDNEYENVYCSSINNIMPLYNKQEESLYLELINMYYDQNGDYMKQCEEENENTDSCVGTNNDINTHHNIIEEKKSDNKTFSEECTINEVDEKNNKIKNIKQSDTKQSDTKQSDAKQSDTKQSDAKQSDTKQSDAKQSDTKQSDAKKSDAKKSGIKQSGIKQSGIKQSDAKQNDAKKSDAKKSDAKMSGIKQSGIKQSDAKNSGIKQSGIKKYNELSNPIFLNFLLLTNIQKEKNIRKSEKSIIKNKISDIYFLLSIQFIYNFIEEYKGDLNNMFIPFFKVSEYNFLYVFWNIINVHIKSLNLRVFTLKLLISLTLLYIQKVNDQKLSLSVFTSLLNLIKQIKKKLANIIKTFIKKIEYKVCQIFWEEFKIYENCDQEKIRRYANTVLTDIMNGEFKDNYLFSYPVSQNDLYRRNIHAFFALDNMLNKLQQIMSYKNNEPKIPFPFDSNNKNITTLIDIKNKNTIKCYLKNNNKIFNCYYIEDNRNFLLCIPSNNHISQALIIFSYPLMFIDIFIDKNDNKKLIVHIYSYSNEEINYSSNSQNVDFNNTEKLFNSSTTECNSANVTKFYSTNTEDTIIEDNTKVNKNYYILSKYSRAYRKSKILTNMKKDWYYGELNFMKNILKLNFYDMTRSIIVYKELKSAIQQVNEKYKKKLIEYLSIN
ncbi:conserved protein, unknown function, partial [Hepatocystis sp. ex Piliocolobus tephrosceles]